MHKVCENFYGSSVLSLTCELFQCRTSINDGMKFLVYVEVFSVAKSFFSDRRSILSDYYFSAKGAFS